MTAIESAVTWALSIASDNSHGYSQSVRWGPSYDCSSLVISAWEQAGVKVKTAGATYTGNMYGVFKKKGFTDVTSKVNLATGSGLQRGDVLLNTASHTAMYIGDGKVVHARSSEGTSDTKDNSGNEIRTQAYWDYPWNYVLRYTKSTTATTTGGTVTATVTSGGTCKVDLPVLSKGSTGETVRAAQRLLIAAGASCGTAGADGDFGSGTENGAKFYQAKKGLTCSGKIDAATWKKLLGVT